MPGLFPLGRFTTGPTWPELPECATRTLPTAVETIRPARLTMSVPNDSNPRSEAEVALPQLSPEQRSAALEKAAAARRVRAELKERLKRGGTTLKQVLIDAETDEALAKLKVSALLEALPGVGKVRAAALMEQFEIAASRRIRGLGERQRQALLAEFGS